MNTRPEWGKPPSQYTVRRKQDVSLQPASDKLRRIAPPLNPQTPAKEAYKTRYGMFVQHARHSRKPVVCNSPYGRCMRRIPAASFAAAGADLPNNILLVDSLHEEETSQPGNAGKTEDHSSRKQEHTCLSCLGWLWLLGAAMTVLCVAVLAVQDSELPPT